MLKDDMHLAKRMLNIKIDANIAREKPKKIWIECVKNYMF